MSLHRQETMYYKQRLQRPQGQNDTRAADIRTDAAAQKAAVANGVPTAPGATKSQEAPGATAAAAKPQLQILPPVQYLSQQKCSVEILVRS